MVSFLKNFFHPSLQIIIESGLILLLVVVLNISAKFIVRNVYQQSKRIKGDFLKNNFVNRLLKPIHTMIWLVGASYILEVLLSYAQILEPFVSGFDQLRQLVIVLGSTWLCFEIKKQFQHSWVQRMVHLGQKPDRSKINLISKAVSFSIIIVALLIVLDTLGIHIGALIALGGVGGLTLGLAAKDVFANFFSGFMLHITRPFSVGEWIHTLDEEIEGTVEQIGFYLTCLKGFDKRPFYVPNSVFTSQIIVNASRMSNRRIRHTVGVRYEDFSVIEKIVGDIRQMLMDNPKIDHAQHLLVDFTEYAQSSLNISIYTFTKTTVWKEWLAIQQEVLLEVGGIIEKHGAEIAYPTARRV